MNGYKELYLYMMSHFSTKKDETWNGISHGIGILLSLIGFFALLKLNTHKTPYSTFSIVVYACTLVMLYTASTVYHLIKDPKKKKLWQKIDHISIYFLIAGTYTPVSLISLEESSGWFIFYSIWSLTAVGTVLKLFFTGKYELISVFFYLLMGWLIVFDMSRLMENVNRLGIFLIFLGGAFYTLGVFFYLVKKIPYHHLIWHLFVLAGSIAHFFFILLDVI